MTVSKLMRLVPLVAVAATLASCGGSGETTGGKVVLKYGLWESRQVPMYQKCADAFQEQNPNIQIQITQTTWNDYWNALAREFIGETAPDVFTDHLAKFPQFVSSDVIEPVSTRGVDMNQYQAGLPSSGRRRTESSTASPRTGTPSPSCPTGTCSRRPGSPRSSSTTRRGPRAPAALFSRSRPNAASTRTAGGATSPASTPATSRCTDSGWIRARSP